MTDRQKWTELVKEVVSGVPTVLTGHGHSEGAKSKSWNKLVICNYNQGTLLVVYQVQDVL